jgi:hypothetical protein
MDDLRDEQDLPRYSESNWILEHSEELSYYGTSSETNVP